MNTAAAHKPFRVIDTGIRPCREQIAFDQALIECHKAGTIPDTVRFLQFPPSVLVGRHQAISQELNLDACREAGVGIGRRITGGGALYLDEGQFGWELVFRRSTLAIDNLGDLAREICEAAAAGLSKLGIDARYRPRNDIEVDGRKISGTGGFFDGSTIFYQGTTLVDMDASRMAALLNIPAAKLAKRGETSGVQRVVTLRELFGGTPPAIAEVKQALLEGFAERLGITPEHGDITADEEQTSRRLFDEDIGTDAFVYEIDDPAGRADVLTGSHTGRGGTITAHLRLEGPNQDRIREIVITGDFFVTPPKTVMNLEAALRGALLADVTEVIDTFFAEAQVGLLTAAPADFATAIGNATAPETAQSPETSPQGAPATTG
ncbi:lipoyl protein ligase domain-containing protein [Microbaculum sp. FT89]|uniref:lipoyl protein ligase domain-containing protein n=1 Tax=Microbaculum sp. FT89 TaxID=3447298 RepID=UPI003F53D29F